MNSRLIAAALFAMAAAVQAQDRVLDDFENPAAWTLSATDDVKASLRPAGGPRGASLCIGDLSKSLMCT